MKIMIKQMRLMSPKNEKTKEKNMNKMDDWIEARLMTAKKNQSAVSTKGLIAELRRKFKGKR